MKLRKPLQLQCNNCRKIFETDIEFECVSTNERNLGLEIDYEGIYDMPCPNCGRDIFVRIEAYEYPLGVVNYVRNTIVHEAEIKTELDEQSFILCELPK